MGSQEHASRSRFYESYASSHSGRKTQSGEAAIFDRDLSRHLPSGRPEGRMIVDLGCGQGRLVEQFHLRGFTRAMGIDISPEQVLLASRAGISNVVEGDYREILRGLDGAVDVVVATDFLEHFDKAEVLGVFESVVQCLVPGGVFIARSPNGTSPFFGNYQYSDFTHDSIFTPRSFAQLSSIAGYSSAKAYRCAPVVHGAKSAGRGMVWWGFEKLLKVALAAETGRTDHIVTQNFVGVARK